jgi:uncharacterized protein (TIGR03435 family)
MTVALGQSFEVASIKPELWNGEGSVGVFVRGNTLTAEHVGLNDLVMFAYNLREGIQLSGGPGWAVRRELATSDLYQVIAKPSGDTPPPMDQFRLMLQNLLADRFQLKVHHVSKEFPVYYLVVGKNGPKLKTSDVETKFSMYVKAGAATRITATHVPVARLVDQIGYYTGRPLFDKTGLTETYDFELDFAPEGLDAPNSSGASIFTAIQEQLGLKFEPGTAPFDTVVIDHAEKPSEN